MKFVKQMGFECLVAAIIAVIMGCCVWFCPLCKGDDVASARLRLQAIEADRKQAEEVATAKATQAAVVPVPDPISERAAPSITFAAVAAVAQDTEGLRPAARLPRAVLVVGQYCAPCLRVEKENPDLIGGPEAPIQVVKNWLANDLEAWGITPGMQLGTPYLFVLDKAGKVHGLSPGGLDCVLRGYQSRDVILKYLGQPEHGISLAATPPPAAAAAAVMATVEHADASPDTFAAVLSAHLMEASGQQKTDDQYLYGGLFDFTVDVPETWKAIGSKILTAQKLAFPTAGITIDWAGPARSFVVAQDKLTISPPVKVTLNKWFINYSASLDGIEFTADLSRVTFLLSGAPDLTVTLK